MARDAIPVVRSGAGGEIPLLKFFRGLGQVGEHGVQGLADPTRFEDADEVAKIKQQETPRLNAIDELAKSGQGEEAFNLAMRVRMEIGQGNVRPGVADAVVGPYLESAKAALLSPSGIGAMPADQRGERLTTLSGFFGRGDPEATRLAGTSTAAVHQGEAAAAVNRANAEQIGQRTPEEVALLKAQTAQANADARYRDRSPGAGVTSPSVPLTTAQMNTLRGQHARLLTDLQKALSGKDVGPDSVQGFNIMAQSANVIADQIPGATHVEVVAGPNGMPQLIQVSRETPQAAPQGAAPVGGASSPGAQGGGAQPVSVVGEQKTPLENAKDLFGDLIRSSRGTRGNVDLSVPDAVAKMADAGIKTQEEQQAVLAALIEEINMAQMQGPPIKTGAGFTEQKAEPTQTPIPTRTPPPTPGYNERMRKRYPGAGY